MELTRMTAAELSAALASGQVSATEGTRAHLDRIAAVDDRVHAFLHVAADSALAQAAEVDERRQPRILAELSRITRLGRGVDKNGRLDPDSSALTLVFD